MQGDLKLFFTDYLEFQDFWLLPGEVVTAKVTVGACLLKDGCLQVQLPEKGKKNHLKDNALSRGFTLSLFLSCVL